MKYTSKLLVRVVAACYTLTLLTPVHAAPLAMSQFPPTAAETPAPNIVVTLDDSNSMFEPVDFDKNQNYPIPPGSTGADLAAETKPPRAYKDGYQPVPQTVDVSGESGYPKGASAEVQQKFVNWYGFYRERGMALKASVMSAFSPTLVPDDMIRLAWQGLIASCHKGFSDTVTGACKYPNAMWTLSDSSGGRNHRTNFYNWLRTMPNAWGTPLKEATQRVGTYFQKQGINSPWASQPGKVKGPELSCRRSYHVMFTDGLPVVDTPQGDADNQTFQLPDGTWYRQQSPYVGPKGYQTVADIAFKLWATDLRPDLTNNVLPVVKRAGIQKYGNADVDEYWNPKNNPATWQHLTTYTIGFGAKAHEITKPQWRGGTTRGKEFAKIVDGTNPWPNPDDPASKTSDIWHAAVNSRGKFFPPASQEALSEAFRDILDDIFSNNLRTGGAVSSLSSSAADFTVVKTGYVGKPTLRADVKGYGISAGGVPNSTHTWDVQEVVAGQSPGSRVILSSSSPAASSGIPFRWTSLSNYQKVALNQSFKGVQDLLGQDRVSYLRGSSNMEAIPDADDEVDPGDVFRDRQGGLIGTVANSEPRIVQAPRSGYLASGYRSFRAGNLKRTSMAYIGANDGMLHGIKTATGAVALSYVPRAAYPMLSFYTDPRYTHRMFVDGPIISSDYQDKGVWKTVLVGGLGAGGKGIFALDITDPSSFSEANANSLVKFDYTAPAGALPADFVSEAAGSPMLTELQTDMGHVFGDPSRDSFIGRNLQVTRMQNGRWAVLVGNGANSVNERAVLYVIYLDGGGFEKIPASLPTEPLGTKLGNGLATPYPADINGDGFTDTVYAGDLLGRMWKFDLKSDDPADWVKSANTKLMIDTKRPITTAPTLLLHPQGGVLVSFGTGRRLTPSDSNSTAMESIYGIWDKPKGSLPVTDSDLAIRQLQDAPQKTKLEAGIRAEARVLVGGKANVVDYGKAWGWKLELLKSGERVIFNPIGDGTRVFFSTSVSSVDPCEPKRGSLLAFDGITGTEPDSPILDINGNKKFGDGDKVVGRSTMGRELGIDRLIGLVSPPACVGPACATSCPAQANVAFGALGEICVSKLPGIGRLLWRDLRP